MADFIFIDERGLKRRLKDMGDGTFAEVVSATGAGGGGGGGAITVADGADITQGAMADAPATSDVGTFSMVALFKRLLGKFPASVGSKASAASLPVVIASDDAQIGTKPTAVSALGSGGAGIIGWLATIFYAVSTQLPASLGIKTSAGSLSVAPASDGIFAVTPAALTAGTDRSSTITTANTAQQLAPANAARKALTGQNISTGDLWINEIGGTAAANTAGSYKVPAGLAFSIATNRVISIVGATAGQAWTATET